MRCHPEQLRQLTWEPALIPNAVEEMLRHDSAAQALVLEELLTEER